MSTLRKLFLSAKKLVQKEITGEFIELSCPFCAFGTPIIYSEKENCCLTCNSKWDRVKLLNNQNSQTN